MNNKLNISSEVVQFYFRAYPVNKDPVADSEYFNLYCYHGNNLLEAAEEILLVTGQKTKIQLIISSN